MDRRRPALSPRGGRAALLYAVPLTFFAVFFLYPVATIVATGFVGIEGIAARPLGSIIGNPQLRGVLWFTVWQAAVSTALTLLAGIPGAYALARLDFPGRRLLRAAVMVPFVLPTVVVGSAFTSLLGPRSPLPFGVELTGTIWAVLIAHVFFNYAVVVRTVGGLWSHLHPQMEHAARTLGASAWTTFRLVTLPLLRPAIAAAAAIVFLFSFTSFGIILILGGPQLATLEVEIYRYTAQLLDLRTASVLTLLQLGGVAAALAVYARLRRPATRGQRLASFRETAHRPAGSERVFLAANLAVMLLLLAAPLAVLVERSFATADGYGLVHYRGLLEGRGGILFVPPAQAIRNSLVFAAAATVIATAVGTCAAVAVTSRTVAQAAAGGSDLHGVAQAAAGGSDRHHGRMGRVLDTVLMLPLGTSAVTVGFGFLIALDQPPLDLRGSALLVPIAQALVATPFVVRVVVPVIQAIDPRLREAAAVLGAAPARVWREVDLRIIRRALGVAAGFAFAISLGEFGATVFLARAGAPTLPVAIFRLLGQPGAANFGQAMAMSTILMAASGLAVLAIERGRGGQAVTF